MSHEIRTPLNAILGMFQLLQRAEIPAKQHKQASVGQQAARRLLKLLTNILEMSRLEAKAVVLSRHEVALRDLVEQWREMAEAAMQWHGKALALAVEAGPELPATIWVDEDRLTQIVQNFIDNAVRFTDDGNITIGVAVTEPELFGMPTSLEIRIADTGCGIPSDQLNEVFDRFHQIDGSIKRKTGGSGLGLAISSDLAALMGAIIIVESNSDNSQGEIGTTLRLKFPLADLMREEKP